MQNLFAFSRRGAAKVADKMAEQFDEPERKVFTPTDSKLLAMPNVHNLKSNDEVAAAFIESEEIYYSQGLSVLMKDFLKRIEASTDFNKSGKKLLESQEISQFYRNFVGIYEMNQKLNNDLQDLRKSGNVVDGMSKVMNKMIPFFKVYTSYIIEYKQVAKFFSKKRDSDQKFFDFCYMNEVASNSSFDTLLSAPVSRLPQYLVFLGGILEKSEHTDTTELSKAVHAIKNVTDDIALKMRDRSKRDQVVTVQQKYFSDTAVLLNPSRYVVKAGPLKQVEKSMISKHKNTLNLYVFVLFNDMMLYGVKAKKLLSGKVVSVMRLKGMSIIEIPDTPAEMYKNAFVIRTPFLSKKPLVVCAPNNAEKENWIKAIRNAVKDYEAGEGTALAGQQGMLDDENFERMIKKLPFVNSSGSSNSSVSKQNPSVHSNNYDTRSNAGGGHGDAGHDAPVSPHAAEYRPASPGGGGGGARPPPPRPPASPVHSPTVSAPPGDDNSGDGSSDFGGGGGEDVPSAPPMSFAAPEAPSLSEGDEAAAPNWRETYQSGGGADVRSNATAASHATAATGGGERGDLLDSIRKAGAGGLKPAAQRQVTQLPKKDDAPVGLQAALKSSLEQYRKFVQDEDAEIHSDDEQDWEV